MSKLTSVEAMQALNECNKAGAQEVFTLEAGGKKTRAREGSAVKTREEEERGLAQKKKVTEKERERVL